MDKMDERIIAVNREYLFDDEKLAFQGVLTNKRHLQEINHRFNNYIEVRRGDVEVDSRWKQPIPYAILKRGEEVFLYRRLNSGGEHRLHDQLSIGVGGHMNRTNDIRNWKDNLMINLYREIGEELFVTTYGSPSPEPKIVGLINDDEEEVGLYHIGILVVLELHETSEVEVRETETLEGGWIRIKDLTKSPLFENLESWSKMAVEVFIHEMA